MDRAGQHSLLDCTCCHADLKAPDRTYMQCIVYIGTRLWTSEALISVGNSIWEEQFWQCACNSIVSTDLGGLFHLRYQATKGL